MRLDKYLKVSRLIKRRTLAKEVCDKGRVEVNGKQAKAGVDVRIGDEIRIRFGHKRITIRVESLQEKVRKEESPTLYTLLHEENIASS
ncbi:RNA-binding S4 domain-containing protein [Mechercharimyces sp. CAU 1602]|uniref:RNA-binding S4 domain-containing protein n=1 Tax=Mechercharimyces sp. CAU 1602 TaxID=2973933 RepID=UPI0021628940|nr:RNA-binding S4 domain-containing protein [Mechercharimyces sp. CAU 1602]MCS1352386.1 RNA-binding S4 domain-containing protein [Mechercharimyces sp. CAU 1602]